MKPRESWKMLATHGPARPSSAVILENWRRWADAEAGRPSVQASARTRATCRKARAWTLEVPDADMAARGWRRARERREPALVASGGPGREPQLSGTGTNGAPV